MRAAIYARVSTDDGRQEVRNQTAALNEYAESMGWTVTGEYSDHISGRKAQKPEFLRMMNDARKRKFDVVLFWSLDRISREGALKVLLTLNQLAGYGVKYRSLQEQWIDSIGAFGDAIIGLLATVAKFEAERISARVKAGLARARMQGKQLGRRRAAVDRGRVLELRQQGMSLRAIAKATGASAMTIQRFVTSASVRRCA
jgi:DNA invertase Pin-like site-specific DNA recombinase